MQGRRDGGEYGGIKINAQGWWESDKISVESWWGFCPHGLGYRKYGNLRVIDKVTELPMHTDVVRSMGV
jgi:hypothetical protein